MRPELELIEKIEDYLKGRLSAGDMAAFRKQIAADPELQEKVKLQEDVMKGLDRASLTQKVKYAGKSFHFGKTIKKWGWGGAATAIVVTSTVLLFNYWKEHNHSKNEGALSQYNESGKKEFADADRKIASQVFSIDGSRDTVIETKGGITFSIPANGFLDENGNAVKGDIQVSVKEALGAGTIMKAGLSTKSGDRLLETGGMFYIDARTSEHILKIDPAKGIYAGVPADTIKPGMQLFQGKRMADGSIDWVDPKPISHDLTTVDIKSLNFYPPFYLDSLRNWGYDISNKKFTDSLYYSFASLFNNSDKKKDAVRPKAIPSPDLYIDSVVHTTGKAVFQSQCASCHSLNRDMTGPNLTGVIARWGGNMKQIGVYLNNYAKAEAAGYPRALAVANFSSIAHPAYSFEEEMVDVVIRYANSGGKRLTVTNEGRFDIPVSQNDKFGKYSYSYNLPQDACGINPAKIRSIWTIEFQNTFIATREFEERLAFLHENRDPQLFDLYINNLDRQLYEVDSMAAKLIEGEEGRGDAWYKLLEFAARRDGNVKNNSPQFQKLREYYQKKTKDYTEAITKVQKSYWDKQLELDQLYNQKSNEHEADSFNRIDQNFEEEFNANLKDVYHQLGYDTTRFNPPVIQPVYTVVVTNTGWNNVDKYVFEATEDRKDMSYTDPETGKTATLTYSSLEVNIVNAAQYDQLYVYLLPNKLSSFMRMEGTGGKFAEKLNALMSYELVCIGYKGEQPFIYAQAGIKPGTYSFDLKQTDESRLDIELKRSGYGTQTAEVKKELAFLRYEVKDRIRQQRNESIYQLWHRIQPFISCNLKAAAVVSEYIGPESFPLSDSTNAK